MDWKPNRESKKPIYKQIADYIEGEISLGNYPPGSMLPSERTLAKQMEVNRSTIVSAYDELQSLGIVDRVKGSGTSVSKAIWNHLNKRIPNWKRYVEDGSFLPNFPLVQMLRERSLHRELINFASGELSEDLFPSEQFAAILAKQPFNEYLGYDHPQGNEQLRKTIALHVKRDRNIETTHSSILITSGAQQAIYFIVQGLLKQGDAVAIEDPSYYYSLPLLRSLGLNIYFLPIDPHGINPDDLIELHRKHRVRMIFLNPNYQNPTGTVLSLARRKRILELSAEYGIPVIEDDPYSLMSYRGNGNPTLKSVDTNGNVLYISSLSKIAAAGLRVGWIVGPTPVIERLADIKQQVDFGHSVFPQWVAHHFLRSNDFDQHIRHLRQELEQRRNEIVAAIDMLLKDEVEYFSPQGGIHLWCKLNKPVNEVKLVEQALAKGVAFTPGSILGTKKNYVRFTFARVKLCEIYEGIRRFKEALKSG